MPARPKRLLVIGIETRYGNRVLSGVHAYCRRHGRWEYRLEDKMSLEAVPRARFSIREWKADGIIANVRYPVMEKLIRDSGLPAVNFSGSFPFNLPTVVSDSWEIGRLGAVHCLQNGLRHFGFCAWTNEPSSQERCKGFVREIKAAGFTCNVFTDKFSGLVERDWVKNRWRTEQWLRSLPKPVGIMCIHDFRGQELSWMCPPLGLRVPDDVALVGVGNEETICQMCMPPLSSVDIDAEGIGYEAARLLHRLMRGGKAPTKPVLVAPRRIVARASTDVVAVEDVEVAEAIRFIRDHAHQPIGVKELLDRVTISRRALERRFEQAIGRAPKAEIVRVRMERAKQMLSETDQSISTVAAEMGFSGIEKFSAVFRRICRITPTQYRRSSRGGGHLPVPRPANPGSGR